jgi:ribonuclease P protein component
MRFSVDSQTAAKIKTGGISFRSGPISIRYLSDSAFRYSPVVSKKQGTSVQRNRIKRVIREIMRAGQGRYPTGSYLVYYNGKNAEFDRGELKSSIEDLVARVPIKCDSRSTPAE